VTTRPKKIALYTVRIDVDDAAFLSEHKRTHKTKIDSRTRAKGRAALAELAQNGRAIEDLFAQVLCVQNPMYIVLELVLTRHLPRFSTRMRRRPLPVGAPTGPATYCRSTSSPWLRRSASKRHSTLKSSYYSPQAKSQTRSKQNKDMHKCSSVYSERRLLLPVLTSGGEWVDARACKNATRVPPSLCDVTQTSNPANPPPCACRARLRDVCSTRPMRTVGPEPLYPHFCGPHVALDRTARCRFSWRSLPRPLFKRLLLAVSRRLTNSPMKKIAELMPIENTI
jgi:hypothetical protein